MKLDSNCRILKTNTFVHIVQRLLIAVWYELNSVLSKPFRSKTQNINIKLKAYHKNWEQPIALHVSTSPDQCDVFRHSLAHIISLDARQELVVSADTTHASTHHVEQCCRRLMTHLMHQFVGEASQ